MYISKFKKTKYFNLKSSSAAENEQINTSLEQLIEDKLIGIIESANIPNLKENFDKLKNVLQTLSEMELGIYPEETNPMPKNLQKKRMIECFSHYYDKVVSGIELINSHDYNIELFYMWHSAIKEINKIAISSITDQEYEIFLDAFEKEDKLLVTKNKIQNLLREKREKIHTRQEIADIFKNSHEHLLSTPDCKIIIDFLIKKYKLEEAKMRYPIEDSYKNLRNGDTLYFDGGYFRISLSCFENYVVYSHNNQELERPLMQEIFDLFPE